MLPHLRIQPFKVLTNVLFSMRSRRLFLVWYSFVVRKVRESCTKTKQKSSEKTYVKHTKKNVSIYAGYFYLENNEKEMVPLKCKNSAKDILFEMSYMGGFVQRQKLNSLSP